MALLFSPLQAATPSPAQAQFSDKEQAWIAEHPIINFTGDPDWMPFEAFTDDGRYIGIMSDLLEIIKKQTSLKFNIVATKSWSESVSLLKQGKVDMMTVSDAWTDPNYLYTNPLLPSPIVIVMAADHPYVDSLYYLQYEKIAVVKGYRYVDEIRKKYPDYDFNEVKNIQEALTGVAEGKYDAALASMALATYTIEKMQLANIKVVGKTGFEIKIRYAVKKAFAPLVGIINKVQIDEKRTHELLREWTYQKYVEKTDYTLITQLVMLLLIILLVAVVLYLLYKKKSQKHQSSEELLSHTQKKINDAIRYASLLDEPSILKPDAMTSFFDDSFIVSYPKNIKSSTLSHFVKLDEDKAMLIVIDAKGDSIDSILNAIFVKKIIKKIVEQVRGGFLDADPAKILAAMETQLQQSLDHLKKESKPHNIGFDAAVTVIDRENNTLLYAGADIPLFYTQNHEVTIVRADRHSIGTGNFDYKNHIIKISGEMLFYLLTSGYIEQTGGSKELPIGKRRIKEILNRYELQDMTTQRDALLKAFNEYKGKEARVGDITMVGFHITNI